LQAEHRFAHHVRLIDFRQADVHIQNLGSRFRLRKPLREDIVHIPLQQSLLEALFAGWIDAFADDADSVDHNGFRRRTERGAGNCGARCRHFALHGSTQSAKIFGCGTAAAAQHRNAERQEFFHRSGKVRRADIIFIRQRIGQTGVRFNDHRQSCPVGKLLRHREQLIRPERAVKADCVRTHPFAHQCHCRNRASGECAVIFFKRHRDKNGQLRILLCRQQRRLYLVKIGHRFNHDHIRSGFFSGSHLLREERIGVLKAQGARRLQQLAQGADVQCNERSALRRFFGGSDSGRNHLLHRHAGSVELVPVCAEGVGIDDLRALLHIGPVNRSNLLRV